MNHLAPQQIARVFALYAFSENIQPLWHIQLGTQYYSIIDILQKKDKMDKVFHGSDESEITFWRLRLAPLSAISEEDAKVLAKMLTSLPYEENEQREMVRDGKIHAESMKHIQHPVKPSAYIFLIHQGYAVPLFFEPNHPDNGKTAIELELAIDKTKEVRI